MDTVIKDHIKENKFWVAFYILFLLAAGLVVAEEPVATYQELFQENNLFATVLFLLLPAMNLFCVGLLNFYKFILRVFGFEESKKVSKLDVVSVAVPCLLPFLALEGLMCFFIIAILWPSLGPVWAFLYFVIFIVLLAGSGFFKSKFNWKR